jgi:hypothetical protein
MIPAICAAPGGLLSSGIKYTGERQLLVPPLLLPDVVALAAALCAEALPDASSAATVN